MESVNRSIRNVEIDPHSSDPAIVLRYDIVENGKTAKKSKIIQLKNFSEDLEPSSLARSVLEQCSLIPANRLQDVEQVLFYLQRRVLNKHAVFGVNNGVTAMPVRAEIFQLEEYIEMLYEDSEKLKASALIFNLSLKPSNLKTIAENDVLIGALTRVLREDSKKNYELATNLASIFVQLSIFTKFHSLLSHHKIGALSLQLIESELKRYELWCEKMSQSIAADQRRKWELAIKKQELFLVECLKILINLSVETKTEVKMVKRGLLLSLIKFLDHNKSLQLLKATILFLWKLSVFMENKEVMARTDLNVIEKIVDLMPTNDSEMANIIFALFFNLSFDTQLRGRMVNAGLMNHLTSYISTNEVALALLYQLSVVDEAKAMFTFTDSISVLISLLKSRPDSLVIKGILVNVSTQKRNAQLICGADGSGLDFLLNKAIDLGDSMLMKVARNISTHEGAVQEHFARWMEKLLSLVQSSTASPALAFPVDALAIVSTLSVSSWMKPSGCNELVKWIQSILKNSNEKATKYYPDEFMLHLIVLCGTLAADLECARLLLPLSDDIIKLLNRKQEDDEFVLQIAFCFARIIAHPELIKTICSDYKQLLEYLINMSHDKNVQLCNVCDQALQLVSEVDKYWFKRIAEERFCWHNAQWLDVVEGNSNVIQEFSDDEEESFLSEQFRNAVFGADDILGNEDDE
ncbi:hypothetical protein M3Y98_00430200 [Aphelenchoides besseyi]|nr:hypothetical protein M3Y98_00430200 [Aphelenchoides besseyi]KAI6202293.1 hypothetical protein M3Y96_00932700 [Aphelenchoides besseyi]